MDKLIDLESVRSMISSIVKENSLSEEEIAECGAACGCGSCATTSADLGAEVQYLGDKKKEKKEFLNFGTTEVNGNDATVNSNNEEKNTEVKDEGLLGGIAGGIIGNQFGYPIAGACLGSIAQDAIDDDEKESVKKEFLDANATAGDISVLSAGNLLGGGKNEASLEEDELGEMSRGILSPQEVAKREYATEFPDQGVKTADQFMRKVILNPEAPGYEKYIQRLAYLIRNVSSDSQFSNIAADVQLNNEDDSDDTQLATDYANAVLGHRKSMSKSSYDSKGLINAYARNIVKRGPYYKPGRDMAAMQQVDLGTKVSQDYDNVEDPSKSNDVLVAFFKSNDWKSLDNQTKMRVLNKIDSEADLDMVGANIIKKMKNTLVSD